MERNGIVLSRKEFAELHNNLIRSLGMIAWANTQNRQLTRNEANEIYSNLYPIASKIQDIAFDSNFSIYI